VAENGTRDLRATSHCRFTGDTPESGLERAGGEEGACGLGQQASGDPAAGADRDGGTDGAAAARGARQLVRDLHGDGAVGRERDAALVGLVLGHVEADAAAGRLPGDAWVVAGG